MTELQQNYEAIWNSVEAEKRFRETQTKRFSKIEISRVWSPMEINKLLKNYKRPLHELRALFKNKFTEDEISDKLKTLQDKVSDVQSLDFLKFIYDHRDLHIPELKKQNPKLFEFWSENTIKFYKAAINTGLRNGTVRLPQRYHKVLVNWCTEDFGSFPAPQS